MTPKTKKILLFVGIAGIATAYLIYRSKKNEQEGLALLESIGKQYSEVDKNSAGNQAIQNIQSTAFDKNKIRIGSLYGPLSNKAISDAVAKATTGLYYAMKGIGTDVKPFATALNQIKNKNTMFLINQTFKAMYGQDLFKMMQGETALNNVQYRVFSDKTKSSFAIPFYSDAHWHPIISAYLEKLPTY